jgi:hypothetical protein
LFRRVATHLRHLPRYPFTDISRADSEFDSVGLSGDQEFHRVLVDDQNILEIDGRDATFFEYAPKYVQVLSSDPTAPVGGAELGGPGEPTDFLPVQLDVRTLGFFEVRDRGRASEHAVVVGRLLRYLLDDIPVLDDLAILEAEEVHKRSSRVSWIVGFEIDIRMGCDEIALRDDSLDV